MANENFSILLNAIINKSGISTELKQVQQIVNKYSIDIMPELKTVSLRNQMKSVSKDIANDFNKAFGTNLTGNDVFKAFENQAKQVENSLKKQTKAIEEAKKAQELYNQKVKEGKALASKQSNDASLSKQKLLYDEISSNQKQVYSLKQKLISSSEFETEEINKQIGLLEKRNKYINYKINKSDLSSSFYEKELLASKQIYENRLKIKEASKIDTSINAENKKNTAELKKQTDQLEKNRKLALEYTKTAKTQLNNAISKYSYGDSSSASALSKQFENGLPNFSNLKNVGNEIDSYKSKVDSIIKTLEHSHNVNLNSINEEIKAENKLATTKQEMSKLEYEAKVENINYERKMYLAEQEAYKTNENLRIQSEKKVQLEKTKTAKTAQDAINLNSSKNQFTNQVNSYLKENSKLSSDLRSRLLEIRKSIDSVDDSNALKNLKNQFREATTEARSLGQTGSNTFEKFTHNLGEFTTFLSAGTLIMSGVNAIRSMVSTVVELDKSLVDLQMATGGTNEETKKLLSTYIDMGQQLGATGTEVASAASDYLRQGKSIAETNELIKDSIVLSKLGNIDAANATTYLTTAYKGYGVAVKDVIGIVDKLSAVDMASATSAGGLAEGMSAVANNARIAGINMDKLLGILAVIGETSGESMSSVGTGVNAMLSRMGNIKLSRLKDYQNNGEDLSNTETVLKGLGVSLRDSQNSFRNFGDVLDEVAGNWNNYDEVSQRAIASSIAGVNHMEQFLILMENYKTSLDYATVSTNSTGTAMEKFANYEQSVEAKTKALQASLQELATDTLNSGVVKSFLDVSNVLVNVTDKVGIFNIAMVALAAIIGAKTTLGMTAFQGVLERLIIKMGVGTAAAETMGMALSTAIPVAGILLGVTALSKFIDFAITTNKELDELSDTATTTYENAKSKLESVNTEFEKQSDLLNELLAKDNLTYVEKGQLEELQKITKELEIQQDLAKKEVERTQKEAALAATKATKKYNLGELTSAGIGNLMSNSEITGNNSGLISDQNNLAGMIAGYKEFVKLKDEAYSSKNEDDMQHFDELTGQISDSIWENVTALQGQKDKMSDYYNAIKDTPYDKMTADQKKVYDSYNQISSAIEKVYDELDPNKLKELNFGEVFDSQTFSKAKKELLELASAGKLSEETISSNDTYKKLINNTGLTAKDVTTQIYALSDSLKESGDSSNNASIATKSYKEILDSVSKKVKLVAEAQYELSDSGKLSYSTVSDLLEAYPELADKLKLTENGYITTDNALQGLIDSQINEYQLAYNDAVDACNKFINNEKLKQAGIDATTTSIKDQMYAMLKLYEAQGQANGDTLREIQNQPTYQNMLSSWMNVGTTEKNLDTATKVTKQVQKETTDKLKDKDKTKKSTKDAYLEAANANIDTLKHDLAMGKITEEKYYFDLEKLNNKYFKGKKKYLDEYRKYEEEVYTGQKKLEKDALDKRKDAIKSEFDELEHKYNSGKIKEADYQNKRWELAKKYYWKNSEYLEEWRKEIENHHKWVVESEEEANKKRVDNLDKTNSAIIESFKSAISDTMDEVDYLDEGSQEQFNKMADAIKVAKNEATYLKSEMANLDKLLKTGKISSADYTSLMKELNGAMDDTSDTVKDLEEKMSKSFKAGYDKVLDDLSDAYDAQTEAIKRQKEAYDEIIDAQIEALNAEKKRHDYEQSIAEKTKAVSDIQSRMAELQKAANSGDRTAAKELKELQDDLSKAQKDLDETQYDHRMELDEEALNKSKKNYDDLKDKELENVKSVYNTKLEDLKRLYAEEEKLITRASQYTKTEFASQITSLNTEISDIIAKINKVTGGKGEGINPDVTKWIVDNQSGLVDVGGDNNSTGLTSSQKAQILSILKNGTGAYYGDRSSALNKYNYSQYGTALSYGQMVSVAKILGVPNINTNADVTGNETNTGAIMKALQKAGFKSGGIVGGKSNNYVKQLTGEDGVGLMRLGEGILKPREADAHIKLGSVAPQLVDSLNMIKANVLSPNSYTTNNSNSPSLKFDKFINVEGNVTSEGADKLEKMIPKLAEQFMDEYMSKILRY